MKPKGIRELDLFFQRVKQRNNRVLIITEKNIFSIYQNLLERYSFPLLVLSPGEETKSRKVKEEIEDCLCKNGYYRNTELVAFGGGVISDLVGFVAATYMRGVLYSVVPTTIIAIADASVGSKTGINTPFGKNLLGAFYPSVDECVVPSFLQTLDKELYKEQFSEVVKMALILDRDLFFKMKDPIMRARELKKEIVALDLKENGLRKILNFGHTFAHAYERVSDYTVSHGKAVWKGIYFASLLSMEIGVLPAEEFHEIKRYFEDEEIDYLIERGIEGIYKAMLLDKKNKGKTPCFILISAIGSVLKKDNEVAHVVTEKIVKKVLNKMVVESVCNVK